jgi:type IV pilus assembly protein PilX
MKPIYSPITTQDGATLIVGLFSLAFLAMIGIFATTTSTIETRAASNEQNSTVAFYAAEIALMTGEAIIEGLLNRADFNEGTIAEHFAEGDHPTWHDHDWYADSKEVSIPTPPKGLWKKAAPPRYSLEQRLFKRDSLTIGIGVPTGTHQFNVYARGADRGNRTQRVLQTVYAKRF